MRKECIYCRYAKQDHTGNWYCTLTTCIIKGASETNE